MSAPRVLVTGATGFVGSALITRLVTEGFSVHGLTRDSARSPAIPGVSWVRGDLDDHRSLDGATRGMDGVFHVGGKVGHHGSWRAYRRTNVEGTRALITAARTNGVRALVMTSTPSVIADGTDHYNVTEEHPYSARYMSPYPESKAMAERLVLAAHSRALRSIVVRPHMIWGPGRSQWVQGMLRRALHGPVRRIGAGRNRVGMTYLDDCVEAHLCAWRALDADRSVGGAAYFVHGGEPIVLWDWVSQLLQACGRHPVRGEVPAGLAMAIAAGCDALGTLSGGRLHFPVSRYLIAELTTDHYSDITRARTRLGYAPRVTVTQGIERIAAAERPSNEPRGMHR